MASKRTLLYRDDGQALTELGLTVGFLCLMLLAVWQVGTVFSNYIDLSEAAREGARAAALSGAPPSLGDSASLTAAQAEGQYAATNSASVPGMTVTITPITPLGVADPGGVTWTAGGKVRATVSAPYTLSLFGVAVTSGTMSVSDDMRVHRKGA
jgi:Flp pilus assembly protein TadG